MSYRQSNIMPNKLEKLEILALDLVCPRVWLTPLRNSSLPIFPVLNRNTNNTCSMNHDSGKTASPHCILFARQLTTPACSHVPTKIKHKHVTETAQRCSATHTTSIALSRGVTTSPTFSHLPVRLTRSWHRPRHLNLRVMERFGRSRHVQCHGLDDAMRRHSATKQVPMASSSSATQNSISPVRFWNRATST